MSLDKLDPSHIDLGLERMIQLMERLGNPHLDFKSVHIAGTNGKGSTAALISSVLSKAGYKTGLYTSPHLERFSERIIIDGDEISEGDIDAISDKVKAAARSLPAGEPTYFEFTTAMAFVYFANEDVDIAIIETGLGGRLDATNIISPLVSVITPVALDHAEYLGSTIEEVAAEKGGIIKEGVPIVIGKQDIAATKVLATIAAEKGAKTFLFGSDFILSNSGKDYFDYSGINKSLSSVEISLYGAHQQENASVAMACLEVLAGSGFALSDDVLKKGLKEASWPGRFEVVSTNPEIILDGAHNPSAAKRLAASLKDRFNGDNGILVVGFMADKDINGILAELAPLASTIILTRPSEERAFDPASGAVEIKKSLNDCEVAVIPDMKEAIEKGIMLAKEESFIIITGSLYAVGEARTTLKG